MTQILNLIIQRNGTNLSRKKLDQERINHFIIYLLRAMTLLMKRMFLNKIFFWINQKNQLNIRLQKRSFQEKKVQVTTKSPTNIYCLKFNNFYSNLRHRELIHFSCFSPIEDKLLQLYSLLILSWAHNITSHKKNIIVVKV